MFEGICSRQKEAGVHIKAAMGIAKEMKGKAGEGLMWLGEEEREIIETIEETTLGDSYSFLEMWAPKEGEAVGVLREFVDLEDARRELREVIRRVKARGTERTEPALMDLRKWRVRFERFRYRSREPLAKKRQVFLHHNIVVSCVALKHFMSMEKPKRTGILADAEMLLMSEDAVEIGEGLDLLLGMIIEHAEQEGESANEDREKAVSLRKKLKMEREAVPAPKAGA